ncbi:YbaK/EbsC family protein [Novispirillum itersonii]|uniref:Prolyl-tRNA editing enzyme YbaK/EbsC (Cys-tRNA(Pro) deacylase) n=1 Tax=Novispirillum itersonii TaxID=189 RepID=A0A7W9ZFL1_NOVIT|nr:YbaK/EbsC family protein [Novispirillum itersonii]MBB6210520.1 prolyl-tRNA editing enzyme YbaK/EbsC (Cys-tRNA(Pro) deacylase) [Novispirillum itersonii]
MTEDTILASASVQRVIAVLAQAGMTERVRVLSDTARTAEDAAAALNTVLGSIVKSLMFTVEGAPVMALVAGDRRCCTDALPRALGSAAQAERAPARLVRDVTGFAIGGVAPVGHVQALPVLIDASLQRFDRLYAAAGHTHCVFGLSWEELLTLTGGTVVDGLGLSAD